MTSQTPPPTSSTGPGARTESDYLNELVGKLDEINVRSRVNDRSNQTRTLTALSPTDSRLNESITCHVYDDGPVFSYSWGDTITGTIEDIAHAIKRVVTAEENGQGVAAR